VEGCTVRVVDGGTAEIIPAAYGIMEVRLIGGVSPRVKLLTRVCSPTERVSYFIGGTLESFC